MTTAFTPPPPPPPDIYSVEFKYHVDVAPTKVFLQSGKKKEKKEDLHLRRLKD